MISELFLNENSVTEEQSVGSPLNTQRDTDEDFKDATHPDNTSHLEINCLAATTTVLLPQIPAFGKKYIFPGCSRLYDIHEILEHVVVK